MLHHVLVGDSGAPRRMFVLHGIYGAGRNWASLARALTAARPDWAINLVDLRLHGHSQGFPPPHTLAACQHDLVALARALGVRPDAVLGHSFGGKVALMSAASFHPRQVWVIDSTPSRRSPGGAAYRMLATLRRLPPTFADRGEAVAALEAEGFAPHVARWMATNLELRSGVYRWKFDLDGIESLLLDFFRRDLWDVVEAPPPPTEIHVVRASESDVLTDGEFARIAAFGPARRVFAHELHGGHWLHVDNPAGLLARLESDLPGDDG